MSVRPESSSSAALVAPKRLVACVKVVREMLASLQLAAVAGLLAMAMAMLTIISNVNFESQQALPFIVMILAVLSGLREVMKLLGVERPHTPSWRTAIVSALAMLCSAVAGAGIIGIGPLQFLWFHFWWSKVIRMPMVWCDALMGISVVCALIVPLLHGVKRFTE